MKPLLHSSAKDLVKSYVDSGVLNKSQVYDLWSAESYEEIVSSMVSFVNLSSEQKSIVWMYVIDHVWKGVSSADDLATVFNEHECVFFRELLNNRGVITRGECLNSVFKTPYLADKATGNLQDMGIVDQYSLRSNEVLYVLNLRFYREVFSHED